MEPQPNSLHQGIDGLGLITRGLKYRFQFEGFTKHALNLFSSHKKTVNEKFEDIEILRFLDLGYKVKMQETNFDSIAVDIPEDVIKVENFLNQKNHKW